MVVGIYAFMMLANVFGALSVSSEMHISAMKNLYSKIKPTAQLPSEVGDVFKGGADFEPSPNPKKITLGLLVSIIQVLMYVNADFFFETISQEMKSLLLLYFIMSFAFTMTTNVVPSAQSRAPIPGFLAFFISFFIAAAVFAALPTGPEQLGFAFQPAIQSVSAALPILLVFGFVISYTEEQTFRDQLPQAGFGDVLSSVLFAFFHLAAYGADPTGLVVAFVAGLVLAKIRDAIGTMGAVGTHTAWNLMVLGAI